MAIKIDELFVEISARTEKLSKGLSGSFPIMGRFASLVKVGPIAAVAALGAAFTVLGGVIASTSVKAFASFEDAMQKSLAIMGDVSDTMKARMTKAARDMARTTSFSAEQSAKSFFYLASAGLDAAQSLAALPTVAKFAQAGMFDMALATDLLTDAQSALGLTIRDDVTKNMVNMARVSDVLVKANTIANATVQQFSEALTNQAGSAMKTFNIDLEEGVAVLAAFADQGVKGSDAGTKFSIVLRDLTSKAIENKKLFKEHQIAVFDDTGATRNLGAVIGDLEKALSGMSDETKKATLLQLGFSEKSLGSLLAILGSSQAIAKYEAQLRSATGITGVIAAKNLDTLKEQAGLLKAEFHDLAIGIGSELAPIVRAMIKTMIDLIFIFRGGKKDIELSAAAATVRAMSGALDSLADKARIQAIGQLSDALVKLGSQFQRLDILGARDIENARRRAARLGDQELLSVVQGTAKMIGVIDTSTKKGKVQLEILGKELLAAREEVVKRGLAFALGLEAPITALAEDEANKRKEITLEEFRTRVALGEASKAALLDRLRFEISKLEEFSDEKGELLLEAHGLELELIDEANKKFEEQTTLREKAWDMLNAATKTLVDNAETELRRFETEVAKAGQQVAQSPEVQAALAHLRDAVETAKILEPLQQEIDAVQERISGFATLSAGDLEALGQKVADTIAALELQLQAEDLTETRRRELEEALKRAIGLRTSLADKAWQEYQGQNKTTAAAKKTKEELEKLDQERKQRLLNLAQSIESGVRGALDLAKAFGIVNDELAESLQAVGQLASGIAQIAGGHVLSGALSIGGAIANLIGGGPSPQEIKQQEVLRDNTKAIDRLTSAIGEFGLDITGRQFEGVGEALRRFFAQEGGSFGERIRRAADPTSEVTRILTSLGLTMDDLGEVAQQLGITFAGTRPTLAELDQLLQAIQAADITRFQDTFSGAMQAFQAEIELFDITKPVDQLEALKEVLGATGTGSELLKQALEGLDLNDAEQRAEAERRIQAIFQALQGEFENAISGASLFGREGLDIPDWLKAFIDPTTGQLLPGALGGLTGDELLDALLQVESLLDEIGQNTEDAGRTQQFAIDRSITEVTGSRIAALLTTSVHWQEETARNTALIAALLSGQALGPVLPPRTTLPIAPDVQRAIGIQMTVIVNGVGAEEAAGVGQKVADATAAELDKTLGDLLRGAERFTGSPMVN